MARLSSSAFVSKRAEAHGKVATRCVKYCHKSAPPSPPFNCNLVKHVQSRSVDQPFARNCSSCRFVCDNLLYNTLIKRGAVPSPAKHQSFKNHQPLHLSAP